MTLKVGDLVRMPFPTEEWQKDKAIDGKYAVIIEKSGRSYGVKVLAYRNKVMRDCWWFSEDDLTFIAPGNRDSMYEHCVKMFNSIGAK